MFVDDLLSEKKGLGEEYTFAPRSLKIQENENGINGVFSQAAIPKDSDVISVKKSGGTLTTVRAYEEALPLLTRLDHERFNLNDRFIEASALYLRYKDLANRDSDILTSTLDIEKDYASSPMRAVLSEPLVNVTDFNNRNLLEYAQEIDSQIELLNIDKSIFRCLLAYIRSRRWDQHGIIPIFDLLNASYGNSANCTCVEEDGFIKFVARRDISIGEELTWNYNNMDALNTWLGYGYVDRERPLLANLELHVDETKKERFEKFLKEHLDIDKDKVSQRAKLNHQIFEYKLEYPQEPPTKILLRNANMSSLSSFRKARSWMRAHTLSLSNYKGGDVTIENLEDDRDVFGTSMEKKMISLMLSTLDKGAEEEQKRITAFKDTDIGHSIDMTPYLDMRTAARQAWTNVLSTLMDILSAKNEQELVSIVNDRFQIEAKSKEGAVKKLKDLDFDNPDVTCSLSLVYIDKFLS